MGHNVGTGETTFIKISVVDMRISNSWVTIEINLKNETTLLSVRN